MVLKWATSLSKTVVFPGIFLHHAYWQRKVFLDRYLERKSVTFNMLIGGLIGTLVYFLAWKPFRPNPVDRSSSQLREDANEILVLMGINPKQEFPGFAIQRLRGEVLTKLHVARDTLQIRDEQREVERLKEDIAVMKQAKVDAAEAAERELTAKLGKL